MDFFVVVVSVKVGGSVSATRFITSAAAGGIRVLLFEVRFEQLAVNRVLIHGNVSRSGSATDTLANGISKFPEFSRQTAGQIFAVSGHGCTGCRTFALRSSSLLRIHDPS